MIGMRRVEGRNMWIRKILGNILRRGSDLWHKIKMLKMYVCLHAVFIGLPLTKDATQYSTYILADILYFSSTVHIYVHMKVGRVYTWIV